MVSYSGLKDSVGKNRDIPASMLASGAFVCFRDYLGSIEKQFQLDKSAHFLASYGANRAMLETMEHSDADLGKASKLGACVALTGTATYVEERGNKTLDPYDAAANAMGMVVAYSDHCFLDSGEDTDLSGAGEVLEEEPAVSD